MLTEQQKKRLADYLEFRARARSVVEAGGRVRISWQNPALDSAGLRAEFIGSTNRRINARAGLSVCSCRGCQKEWEYRRDQRKVRDFRVSRVVQRGSGFETEACRRRFPDIQERMVETLEY